MSVLTVEPLYICLADYKLLPPCQSDIWDGLWNAETTFFYFPDSLRSMRRIAGSLDVFDDGHRQYFEVCTSLPVPLIEDALTALESIAGITNREEVRSGMVRAHLKTMVPQHTLESCKRAVIELFRAAGYATD